MKLRYDSHSIFGIRFVKNLDQWLIGVGKQTELSHAERTIITFSSVAQRRSRAIWDRYVIRTGVKYTHVLNKMSAAGVIEQGRLDVSELFIYHAREYIFEITMIPEHSLIDYLCSFKLITQFIWHNHMHFIKIYEIYENLRTVSFRITQYPNELIKSRRFSRWLFSRRISHDFLEDKELREWEWRRSAYILPPRHEASFS